MEESLILKRHIEKLYIRTYQQDINKKDEFKIVFLRMKI